MAVVQSNSKLIVVLQGLLMISIATAPALTGYRFLFPEGVWDWAGTILMLAGTGLVILSVHALRSKFTIQVAVKNETILIQTFPFNFSRNPMYLGGLLMCFSWSLLQRSPLAAFLSALLCLVLNSKVKIEEKNLEQVFGESYIKYKNSVGRFF